MSSEARQGGSEQVSTRASIKHSARSYARGVAGGLLVSMPLLATMEMWWLGFYLPPWKLILFLVVNYGILVVLEYYSGFQEHTSLPREAQDALSAYGIGFVVAAIVLYSFHVLRPGMALQEILGKIILESIPVSIGVSIAISQLGQKNQQKQERKERSGFWGTQAIAAAGALYFGFNIAPTVEPLLLGLRIEWWHALILVFLSLLQVHAIVYGLDFQGGRKTKDGTSWWRSVFENSVTTYLVALLVAAYLLWTFGRIGPETGFSAALHMIVVLGFVNSLGAAAGKIIL